MSSMPDERIPRWLVDRHLDPGERLSEVLFGLIMVLTFTLTARVALGEGESPRSLLAAALACNVAWGLIDGGMYIMNAMLERGTEARALAQATGGKPVSTRLTRDDLKGALGCFFLVVASAIPALVPFLLIDDAYLALRASNALLVGLLFAAGYVWGYFANTSRWAAGLAFLLLGLACVGVAIALEA